MEIAHGLMSIELLCEDERNNTNKSARANSSHYRFGDGKEIKSEELIIPVIICGRKLKIGIDVVNSNILLLISRPAYNDKSCDFVRHDKNHKVIAYGKKTFKLESILPGHYMIPVWMDRGKLQYHSTSRNH